MALYKEQNMQEHWRNRVARERRNISKSVEETLADASSQEELTDDIYDEPFDSNASLVPPRLSLQSKVLPSVRSETFVQSVTAELAAQKRTEDDQQKPQNPGILARFAQHVTSSIAAIGSALQPATPDIPLPPEELSLVEESQRMSKHVYLESPREAQKRPSTAIIDAIPSISSPIPTTLPVRSKQRLAGHTAKIRLQTASTPKPMPRPKEQEWHSEQPETVREPLTVNVRFRENVQEPSYSNAIVAITPYEEKKALPTAPRNETNYASFFGSGAFESGQSELMVRNAQTTAASVVHVTLTSKPGPTLVQYVSLHPEVGFTLHLTAPVERKTTFNYALFVEASNS